MSYQGFEELDVWKKAREVKKEIFELVKSFPNEEKFRLADQLVRSIRSVPAQISEGHGRRTFPDRLRFSIIARGSLSESLNHLIDAFDCNYISDEQLSLYRVKINEVERILNGYISYLEKNSKK
ncbi:MAG: four helix bundle protein [Chitinophagaceae bacterium]|nr:four helix bundle protein [Chitinophagaceae bacterium]